MRLEGLIRFLKLESTSGLILIVAGLLALICANTPLWTYYSTILHLPFEVRIGNFLLAKPVYLWVNEGLMAIFFFLLGAEVKRGVLEGELRHGSQTLLSSVAALAGVVVPALIYWGFNHNHPVANQGWAIPAATDTAFALGLLSFFSRRVPSGLKLFLLTLSILDDLAAIIIMAIFYIKNLSFTSLYFALLNMLILFLLNRAEVKRISVYLFMGVLLWVFVLESGVHATLAGVILAWMMPLRVGDKDILIHLEDSLRSWVAFVILPVFAFMNAGIPLASLHIQDLIHPMPLGIILGLFVGKPLGIMLAVWWCVRRDLANLPANCTWPHMWGVSVLCGIGFTMSFFIGSLAFGNESARYVILFKLGVLAGSLLSSLVGCFILYRATRTSDN